MENTCETYHTSVVHKKSLGPMKAAPAEAHIGNWDAVMVPSKRSIVPLPSDFEGVLNPLPVFTNQTAFINIFPSLQINATWDCLWFMRLIPWASIKLKLKWDFAFQTKRLLCSISKSTSRVFKAMASSCQRGQCNFAKPEERSKVIHRVPGRFSQLEFGTHNFNNWLISKIVPNVESHLVWNPGKRAFVGRESEKFSNDDERMLHVVENGLY